MRILESGTGDFELFIKKIGRRGEAGFAKVEGRVRRIVNAVKRRGDAALLPLTRKYDGWPASAETLRVSAGEMRSALKKLPREDRDALEYAAFRIEQFHLLQKQRSWLFAEEDGTILGQAVRPLKRAGIYVPGGKASYPSSMLMNALPARVAGVSEIIAACPAPGGYLNPRVLAAAAISGVERLFKIGGAQAVAALAYGTRTVPRVDKIVGPGNIYVAAAKRIVFGEVAVDSIAGPSEILIIADRTGVPAFLAADLLSQAEHDELASAVLLCLSKKLAEKVREEVRKQSTLLPRRQIAAAALRKFGAVLIVKSLAEACRIATDLAPEHLELAVADPFSLLEKVENAGAVFLGHYSPEAIGDYVAGPNHVLPTGGTARFSSPLGVYDFVKRSSLVSLSAAGATKLSRPGLRLARMEGLEGHARSIEKRRPERSAALPPRRKTGGRAGGSPSVLS
jgi:histidinol dehydrogenase